jgi:hypothetical protein
MQELVASLFRGFRRGLPSLRRTISLKFSTNVYPLLHPSLPEAPPQSPLGHQSALPCQSLVAESLRNYHLLKRRRPLCQLDHSMKLPSRPAQSLQSLRPQLTTPPEVLVLLLPPPLLVPVPSPVRVSLLLLQPPAPDPAVVRGNAP